MIAMKDTERRIFELLKKYMDRKASPQEEEMAVAWLQEHAADPAYDDIFERLLDSTSITSVDEASLHRRKNPMAIHAGRRGFWGWMTATVVAAAAVVMFILGARPEEPIQWNEIYAERGKTERIVLPDGTGLWLNSDSKVIYPSRFDDDLRTIFVDGEIYADVVPDKSKPFIVSASGVKVKVFGTKFGVKAFAGNPNVEVALISGSVAVEDENESNGFSRLMNPGEMIRYNRQLGTVEDYRIDPETYGSWQNNHNIRFINQTLEDIASDLERRFDVKILIEDRTLAKTRYYASFINNEGIDKILKALNGNGSMRISKKHDTIVISPR